MNKHIITIKFLRKIIYIKFGTANKNENIPFMIENIRKPFAAFKLINKITNDPKVYPINCSESKIP